MILLSESDLICLSYIRQNSNVEKDYLMVRELTEGALPEWKRKFCVFEDGEFKYADDVLSKREEFTCINMDQVVNLCADVSGVSFVILCHLSAWCFQEI